MVFDVYQDLDFVFAKLSKELRFHLYAFEYMLRSFFVRESENKLVGKLLEVILTKKLSRDVR